MNYDYSIWMWVKAVRLLAWTYFSSQPASVVAAFFLRQSLSGVCKPSETSKTNDVLEASSSSETSKTNDVLEASSSSETSKTSHVLEASSSSETSKTNDVLETAETTEALETAKTIEITTTSETAEPTSQVQVSQSQEKTQRKSQKRAAELLNLEEPTPSKATKGKAAKTAQKSQRLEATSRYALRRVVGHVPRR